MMRLTRIALCTTVLTSLGTLVLGLQSQAQQPPITSVSQAVSELNCGSAEAPAVVDLEFAEPSGDDNLNNLKLGEARTSIENVSEDLNEHVPTRGLTFESKTSDQVVASTSDDGGRLQAIVFLEPSSQSEIPRAVTLVDCVPTGGIAG